MHFVVIFGPPAVGKMTVGYELAPLTEFKLFHNHMTIELVLNFFSFDHPQSWKLVGELRGRIFEEVATSDLPGFIFTYVWALDDPGDKASVDTFVVIFRDHRAEAYFVELEAEQAERLRLNSSEFRLAHKPSKRDVARSQQNLLDADKRYKLNSTNDFFYQENYLKINTTSLSAVVTAKLIVDAFGFSIAEHPA